MKRTDFDSPRRALVRAFLEDDEAAYVAAATELRRLLRAKGVESRESRARQGSSANPRSYVPLAGMQETSKARVLGLRPSLVQTAEKSSRLDLVNVPTRSRGRTEPNASVPRGRKRSAKMDKGAIAMNARQVRREQKALMMRRLLKIRLSERLATAGDA